MTARPHLSAAAALVLASAAATMTLGGCAESMQWRGWSAPPQAPPPSGYPRAPVVMLYIEERYHEYYGGRSDTFTRKEHREARAILTEKGIEEAYIRIPLGKSWHLRWVHARTVQPDGTFQEVPASDVLVDTSNLASDERREITTWRVRFPAVRVGSVIECAYSTQNEAFLVFAWDRVPDEYPIARYSRELIIDRPLRFSFKLYNSSVPVIADVNHDPAHVRIELADIPARSDEPYLPRWITYEPFWLFRIRQVSSTRAYSDLTTTWDEAIADLSRRLTGERGNLYAGAPSIKPAEGCRDLRCRLTWAIDQARDRTEWTGLEDEFRPLSVKRVLAQGVGDDADKAVLLLHLLRAAGVQVELGFAGGLFDREFPFPRLLSRPLVRVPAQQGLAQPLWIDPACEYCAPGELLPEVIGAGALVLEVHGRVLASDEHKVRFENVTGPARDALHHHPHLRRDARRARQRAGACRGRWRGEARRRSGGAPRARTAQTIGGRMPTALSPAAFPRRASPASRRRRSIAPRARGGR